MAKLNEFGIKVKHRLIDLEEPQTWLIEEVRKRTGKYMDSGYLSKLMTGKISLLGVGTVRITADDVRNLYTYITQG